MSIHPRMRQNFAKCQKPSLSACEQRTHKTGSEQGEVSRVSTAPKPSLITLSSVIKLAEWEMLRACPSPILRHPSIMTLQTPSADGNHHRNTGAKVCQQQ